MAEQLHDLASRRRRLQITVHDAPVYDLILALWSASGGNEKSRAHDLGKNWFSDFTSRIPEETRVRIDHVVGEGGSIWIDLLGVIATADLPSLDAVIDWLELVDSDRLRADLLTEMCWQLDPEVVDEAVGGDSDALERALKAVDGPSKTATIRQLCRSATGELGTELAAILRSVRETAFAPHEAEWNGPLAASAQAVRPLLASMDPKNLIERVTNGIDYDLPLGTTRLILIPSVVVRPWTTVTEHGSAIIVIYPVGDEFLQADPDAPPSWLVTFYKAVGDERRLRMLRRLAEGEATLATLTETVGLAKSTVFHHIGVLRAAGLLRVQVSNKETGPTYTLRPGAFTDARCQLDRYLSPPALPKGERGET